MDTPRTFLDMLPVFDELEINELALSDIYQGERTMTFL